VRTRSKAARPSSLFSLTQRDSIPFGLPFETCPRDGSLLAREVIANYVLIISSTPGPL
jgi:hypothetical protein